jgi:hypothetical protein
MADQEDEGDVSDFDARLADMAAAAAALTPVPPADDYQRHLRAEARWQARLAAHRLWERVKRCLQGLD